MSVRVLDLGAHDGFVGKYLLDQLGDSVEMYGMELHPDAAQKARDRGYTQVAEGLAEDAEAYFPAHSFDLVVAYEIIEHVPDTDTFLRVCERMLKPDGRILISTPDGVFGEGDNPHHLRALRSIDVADLLRRRGSLVDMGVGGDGVTVAAYRPQKRRGEIAVYTGPCWDRWHPMDIATRGLGGSETAAYRVSEALADLGYVVTLYAECDEGMMRDVMIRDWRTFDPTVERLAVISSRMPELYDRPVNAPTRMLWCHDTDMRERLTQERAAAITDLLCLSQWHKSHLAKVYPFAAHKLRRIRNGITPSFFTTQPPPEREPRVLYTSSPDRGLDILMEMWPTIREAVPEAELIHTYAPVYDKIAETEPHIAKYRERVRELSEQPGVRALSGLPQGDLANLMRSSKVWAHPAYSTPYSGKFMETSCIGAMEAQAAGCCVVAGNWGALTETVQVGTLITGEPDHQPYRDRFAEAIVNALTDERIQRNAQVEGPEIALTWDWSGVAEMIAALVEPVALAAA